MGSDASGTPSVLAAVGAAHAAIDSLAADDLHPLADDDLLTLWRELERLRRRLPVIDARLVLESQTRSLPASLGARDTARFLRGLLRLDPREAAGRVRSAEAIGERETGAGQPSAPAFPLLASAQAAGAVSERHARVIVESVDSLPDQVRLDAGGDVESTLVEHATRFEPYQLARIARRLSDSLDPEGTLRDAAYRSRVRRLDVVVRPDGSSHIDGDATAELTELLLVHLDSLARPRPAVDGQPDPRTAGQRRHDALLDALQLSVRSGQLPSAGGVAATMIVTMTEQSYRSGTGLATTGHGALVPAGEALRWGGGDARILAVVMDRIRGVTAYSTPRRIYSEGQRLALIARDKGCTFPGCTAPPGWTQIHHMRDHTAKGPTTLDNGAMVCGHDHRERIREGWSARLINGRVGWIPPQWIDPQRRPRFNEAHTSAAA